MNKIITYETIRNFAYVNDNVCKKPIKGVVVYFCGLGNKDMFDEDTNEGIYYGEEGVLYIHPYNNPWSWMNAQAVAYTDEIIDAIFEHFSLPESTPIVSMGQSMGGLASLVYTRYAKRTPVACIANCPVCDLVYHFTERPDLPRTIYSALWNEDGDIGEAMKKYSPVHLAPTMPDAKYYIFHCDKDKSVNLGRHSEKFVEAMRSCGKVVELEIIPDRGHCKLTFAANGKRLRLALDYIGCAK
ncbi:MAG: prolyl oligopeptidase family serine peptidase [Clostridia bacterium]|nr:prolyl oligopeptidase family serine peptidase [Clostridia bacterium]